MIKRIISDNKAAMGSAAKLESSKEALKLLKSLCSKHLPENMQDFAESPIGSVVLANAALTLVEEVTENKFAQEMA